MSYIIKCSDAFINIKLTQIGRKKLSMGQLNFKYWGAGDSEVNYIREEVAEASPSDVRLSGTTDILRPKDRQPNFVSFLYTGGTTTDVLKPLTNGDINVLEIVANNKAETRGFYSGDTLSTISALTQNAKFVGFIANDEMDGTDAVDGITNVSVGDWVMIKFTNDTLGNLTQVEAQKPVPYLWYRVKGVSGSLVTFDRDLPNLTPSTTHSVYYVYESGEVYDTYGASNESAYWDKGTLSFNASCGVTLSASPVWNMSIPYSETMAGSQYIQTEALYEYYGSQDHLGTMYPYLNYQLNPQINPEEVHCTGVSEKDPGQKNIAILHYTNRNISNSYGEFFYINGERTTKVTIPSLMYHRKTDATKIGMEFIASGDVKTIQNTGIEYVDLIEEPTLIGNLTPRTVGKVFPTLKIIIFDNEEIVSAMSFKSNRSWTLPGLSGSLVNPNTGANTGILDVEKTMYITYGLENSAGLTTPLSQQIYGKLTNNTSSSRNVEFKIEDIDLLKYMHKIEGTWDGTGFYADKFKLIYQIVDTPDERPDPQEWLVQDFTNGIAGQVFGETIDPNALENQIPSANNFLLTTGGTSTTYNIDNTLGLLPDPTGYLTFGDERFFYGNIDAHIGATTFKTTFDIRINSGDFDNTSNPTMDPTNSNVDLRVSEVGVFDKDKNLVVVGKLMDPIELIDGNTILIELSLDF